MESIQENKVTLRGRALKILRAFAYLVGLVAFYLKYVPLVAPFQAIFVPILLVTTCLTWRDRRMGALFFVFVFPLINGLPYFFGIHEPFPSAPAALVLFLFFFLGVLMHRDTDEAEKADGWGRDLSGPLAFWAVLIAVSAAVTFFRYANFFPFQDWTIYEIKTNTYDVSAGGALMSVIFNALNYLTGLAFFWVLSRTVRSDKDVGDVLRVLGSGTLLSMGFALFQHFGHVTLGNNPASYWTGLINGTFKDALSFGAYLSMIAPLFLGLFFSTSNRGKKILSLAIVVLAIVLVMFSGSKIGLGSLLVTTAILTVWRGLAKIRSRRGERGRRRRMRRAAAGVAIVAAIAVGILGFGKPIISRLNGLKIVERLKNTQNMIDWRIRAQWDPGVKMLRDYPLTGVGLGGFIIETANYTTFYKSSKSVPESAENYLLQVGTELGAVGLLAVLAVCWALFRKLRGNFREKAEPRKGEQAFLARGAALGILSFALDAQMHSFIGSYEIKYTLWLLIALLFAMSRGPEAKAGAGEAPVDAASPASRRRWAAAFVFAILAFGLIHLWNSTHSLSLRARTEKLGIVQDFGLYPLEKSPEGREYRWTREYGAFPIKSGASALSIAIHAAHPDIGQTPVKVRIYLVRGLFRSSRLLKDVVLGDNGWKSVDLPIGEGPGEAAILLLKVDRTWNPKKALGAADPRNLGVAVAITGGL